ncbi:GNAT family N-acetyltransferase [Ascidiimonas aurantiaca]|uniref:GNAT family N-acetyltransferase n=1 Tax=Ascidiimonas aurantiaca TaxID=1685432 RepID=UPI0030ECAEE4
MKVIVASISHVPVIRKIALKTWPYSFKEMISAEQINYMLELMYSAEALKEQINEKGHTFLLAEENGTRYGYAAYEVNHDQKPETKIHKLYVLPESQGKGVGKILLKAISEIAQRHKNTSLMLTVNRHNKAIKFYESQGFAISGTLKADIGGGFFMDDYIMKKPI